MSSVPISALSNVEIWKRYCKHDGVTDYVFGAKCRGAKGVHTFRSVLNYDDAVVQCLRFGVMFTRGDPIQDTINMLLTDEIKTKAKSPFAHIFCQLIHDEESLERSENLIKEIEAVQKQNFLRKIVMNEVMHPVEKLKGSKWYLEGKEEFEGERKKLKV